MDATKTKPFNIEKEASVRRLHGAYTPSALQPIWHYVNATLVAWVMRKYKRYRGAKIQAGRLIEVIAVKRRRLFVHWKLGVTGMSA